MITKDILILGRFVSEIDGTSLDTLEGRIAFQKRIYLLQVSGIDLGYRFGWDVYGPYSPGLAKNGVRYESEMVRVEAAVRDLQLTEEARNAIERVRRTMALPPGAPGLTETAWLELLCSLHFIADTLGVDLSETESLTQELVKRKPFFADYGSQTETALQRLRDLRGD